MRVGADGAAARPKSACRLGSRRFLTSNRELTSHNQARSAERFGLFLGQYLLPWSAASQARSSAREWAKACAMGVRAARLGWSTSITTLPLAPIPGIDSDQSSRLEIARTVPS